MTFEVGLEMSWDVVVESFFCQGLALAGKTAGTPSNAARDSGSDSDRWSLSPMISGLCVSTFMFPLEVGRSEGLSTWPALSQTVGVHLATLIAALDCSPTVSGGHCVSGLTVSTRCPDMSP